MIKRFRDAADSTCFVVGGAINVSLDVQDWFLQRGLISRPILGTALIAPGFICAVGSGVVAFFLGIYLELTLTRIRPI